LTQDRDDGDHLCAYDVGHGDEQHRHHDDGTDHRGASRPPCF
jgi:hypothetical protein